jgi:hypothetical protein
LKNVRIGFAGIFSGNLYIFRFGVPNRAQHHFEKRQFCRFRLTKELVVAHQEPEAVSGGRSQAVTPRQGGDSTG